MATVAEFVVPADTFPLGHLFEVLPEVTIEIERVVPTNRVVLPYFWVRGVPAAVVRNTLEARGELDSFSIVDEFDSQALVRADWDPDVEGVLTGIVETELTLLSAEGTDDEWRFEFRADDQSQIADFQQYCLDREVDARLVRLHDLGEGDQTGQYSLTPEQREALLLAYENGYYEFPRETDLEALADDLDIARQSFADRLRRGHRNLIAETLAGE